MVCIRPPTQVPIGNLVFALPFMPQSTDIHFSDLLGLAVIVLGLILYRFMDGAKTEQEEEPPASNTTPWFQDLIEQLGGEPLLSDTVQQQLREPLLQETGEH